MYVSVTRSPMRLRTLCVQVISNHGHPDYTCLYRIRVHGSAAASNDALPQADAEAAPAPEQ